MKAACLGLAMLIACAGPAGASTPSRDGASILIGGNFSPRTEGIYASFLGAAGGTDASIGIVDVAAGSPRDGRVYVRDLRRAGVEDVRRVPIHGRDAADEANSRRIAARVRRLDGILFSGGNQLRATRALLPGGRSSRTLRAIRSAHRRGAAIAGSSAGLHVQTDPMISGGESFEALRFGVARRFDERGVRVSRGLWTFGEGIADSHFDARGRIGRLLRAGLARGERWALGIEEDTALVVDGRDARVVGSGGVTVLDLADASGGRRARFAVAGVGLDYLLAGDRIDLRTGLVSPSTERDTEVPPSGLTPGAPLIEHVLRPYGSRDLIQELGTRGLESVSGAAARRRAGFEIEVARLPGTVVLVDEDGGPATVAGAAMRVEPIG